MRLIDADALISKGFPTVYHTEFGDAVVNVEDIDKQPTIDAVEVVRCEKCRHGITAHGISDGWVLCSKPYATDTVGGAMHRCDWFCGDGNRKEQNDEE